MAVVDRGARASAGARRAPRPFESAVGVTRRELSRLIPAAPPSARSVRNPASRRIERLVHQVMTTRGARTP